jgi:hypothetical protein
MAVAFKELAGSPAETFGLEGVKATRRILVAWEQRQQMVVELLGGGYEFGGLGPAGYPDCLGAVAVRASLEPWPPAPDEQGAFDDIASQLNSYSGKYALIVVEYEVLDARHSRTHLPRPRAGTLLTYRLDLGKEHIILPAESMLWSSDASLPVPPEAVPTIRVPISEHHVTWHRAVNPPWTAIRACLGTVNGAEFLGAAPETVLFDGATAQRQFLGVDALRQPQFGWQIGYVFREMTIKAGGNLYGWNHRYRPLPQDDPGWDKLVDRHGNSLYRSADFSSLFEFEAVE